MFSAGHSSIHGLWGEEKGDDKFRRGTYRNHQQQKNELSQKVDSVVDEMEKTKSEIDHSIKKIDSLLEDF